jgi:hypothetical protein
VYSLTLFCAKSGKGWKNNNINSIRKGISVDSVVVFLQMTF